MQTESKYFTLNNGMKMPCLGLGVFRNKDPKECENSIICAIENGYRMIDTAAVYGNEQAVGNAVKHCGIPREELFITTKLWYADCSRDLAKRALDRSLKKLGLGYVDLYLVHEPYGWLKSAWRGLEESVADGKVRAIGVSNFGQRELEKLLGYAKIAPAVDQIELHPYFQRKELLAFLKECGIQPEAWAPFGAGKSGILDHPVIARVAERRGCTVAQAVLAWLRAKGAVAIPKSSNPDRMAENLASLSVELTEEDIRNIDCLDLGDSLFPWDKGIRRPLRKAIGFLHYII